MKKIQRVVEMADQEAMHLIESQDPRTNLLASLNNLQTAHKCFCSIWKDENRRELGLTEMWYQDCCLDHIMLYLSIL